MSPRRPHCGYTATKEEKIVFTTKDTKSTKFKNINLLGSYSPQLAAIGTPNLWNFDTPLLAEG